MVRRATSKPFDTTKLQGWLAVASFSVGVVIALVALFFVPPPGEISNSAISIVSEFLVLAGALLGIKTGFDLKMQKFEADVERRIRRTDNNDDDNGRF